MPTCVIDAGLVVKLLLPGPQQPAIRALFDEWHRQGTELIAPDLLLYEVTSVLRKAVHFGALTDDEGRRALALVVALPLALVAPDAQQAHAAYEWTARLRRAAAYDSFYLALADGLHADLWTTDQRLSAAVGLPWVRLAA